VLGIVREIGENKEFSSQLSNGQALPANGKKRRRKEKKLLAQCFLLSVVGGRKKKKSL